VVEVHMIVRAALDLAVQRRLVDHNVAYSAHRRRRRSPTTPARAWSWPPSSARPGRRCVYLDPTSITELDRWRRRLRLDALTGSQKVVRVSAMYQSGAHRAVSGRLNEVASWLPLRDRGALRHVRVAASQRSQLTCRCMHDVCIRLAIPGDVPCRHI
jgi:hypothetical protein